MSLISAPALVQLETWIKFLFFPFLFAAKIRVAYKPFWGVTTDQHCFNFTTWPKFYLLTFKFISSTFTFRCFFSPFLSERKKQKLKLANVLIDRFPLKSQMLSVLVRWMFGKNKSYSLELHLKISARQMVFS